MTQPNKPHQLILEAATSMLALAKENHQPRDEAQKVLPIDLDYTRINKDPNQKTSVSTSPFIPSALRRHKNPAYASETIREDGQTAQELALAAKIHNKFKTKNGKATKISRN